MYCLHSNETGIYFRHTPGHPVAVAHLQHERENKPATAPPGCLLCAAAAIFMFAKSMQAS